MFEKLKERKKNYRENMPFDAACYLPDKGVAVRSILCRRARESRFRRQTDALCLFSCRTIVSLDAVSNGGRQ